MRVQGTNTAISGPVGALPVPVPLREDAPFADHVANANRPHAPARASPNGPLALTAPGTVFPDTPPLHRMDAARAYARAASHVDHRTPPPRLSLKT